MKVYELFENAQEISHHIVEIFGREIKAFSDNFKVTQEHEGKASRVQFWNIAKKYKMPEQTITFWLEPGDGGLDLHLENVYVPTEIANKGYLTRVLSQVRKLPGLSGYCVVHVAMNPAWEKIIERSGFKSKKPEIHPMFHK